LRNYLAETDTYFKSIDKLYNKTLEQSAYMDTSNPEVAKRVNNYTNYLQILRNKQNDRNVSFIEMAGDQVEKQLEALKFEYKTKYDQFSREYNTEAELTTETYNDYKKIIEEMTSNLDEQQVVLKMNQELKLGADGWNGWTIKDLTSKDEAKRTAQEMKDSGSNYYDIDATISKFKITPAEKKSIYYNLGITEPKTTTTTNWTRLEELMNSSEGQKKSDAELLQWLKEKNDEEKLGVTADADYTSKIKTRIVPEPDIKKDVYDMIATEGMSGPQIMTILSSVPEIKLKQAVINTISELRKLGYTEKDLKEQLKLDNATLKTGGVPETWFKEGWNLGATASKKFPNSIKSLINYFKK
jgi:uncharacterized membrane-anchored protein YhcB (DUF1043 family)